MKGKKAQLTAFIIIAIVLLLSTALTIYIRQKIVEYQPEIEPIAQAPLELQPIQTYVESCLFETSLDGLRRLSMQSGWISTQDETLSGKKFTFFPDPTLSQGTTFANYNIPYWWHMSSDNNCYTNCRFDSHKPGLKSSAIYGEDRLASDTSIEAQIDRYVNLMLDLCLENFNEFRKQEIEVTPAGDVVTTTIVTEKEVVVTIDYPLEILQDNKLSKMSEFRVVLPIKLKGMYELSEEIVKNAAELHFIEIIISDLIKKYSGMDEELAPTERFSISPGDIRYWTIPSMEDFIRNTLLPPFVMAIQVQDTLNYDSNIKESLGPKNDPVKEMRAGILALLEPKILKKAYNFNANFMYNPKSEIYLDVTPRNGLLVGPTDQISTNIANIIPFFTITYETMYDVSFPVIVMINDPTALNDKGFTFQFAMEANIRNNRPFGPNKTSLTLNQPEKDLFTDRNMWVSGNITIETMDKKSSEALPGVEVKYECGTSAALIGYTELNDEGKAILVSKFPICRGGVLYLTKERYLTLHHPLDTEIGKPASIQVTI